VTVDWDVTSTDGPPDPTIVSGCGFTTVDFETTGTQYSCEAASSKDPGVTASKTIVVKADRIAPVSTGAAASRGPNASGWYTSPVDVAWSGVDGTSGIASCTRTTYAGPDNAAAAMSGTCRDQAGNTSLPFGFGLRYDATAPVVSGVVPTRPAGDAGIFTSPVDLVWSGTDATSGIDACTVARFDGTGAPPSGTCRDRAGNLAAAVTATPPRYDDEYPVLERVVAARLAAGARISWRSAGADRINVRRRPGRAGATSSVVYTGAGSSFVDPGAQRGRDYRYTVEAADEAGHVISANAEVKRATWLLAPEHSVTLDGPPELLWRGVRRARFYNVQLFRGDRKILTSWPRSTKLQLKDAWTYRRRRERLSPGTYRWYVWASHGTRKNPRYGRMLGGRGFVIE
jgi:hypothetical protein